MSQRTATCIALHVIIVTVVLCYPLSAQTSNVSTDSAQVRIRTHTIDGAVTITAADVLQDVSDVGGIVDLSLADGELTVVSDNVNDTLLGTGAQRIVLRGNTAGSTPKFLSIEIDMDGEVDVVTTGISFQGFSLAQARVVQSDDLERRDLPTGTITIQQNGVTVGLIQPGSLQTRIGYRRIPYGPNGEIETWSLTGGQICILDLAGKADATATLSLWTASPGDQIHTDGALAIRASVETCSTTFFAEDFDSGETFLPRVQSDQSGVKFFVSIGVAVRTSQRVPVIYTRAVP